MMQNRRLGRNCILGDEMVRTPILRAQKPLCPQCCRASLQLLACPAHAGLLSKQHVVSTPSQVLEPGASLLGVCQRRVYCSTTRGAQGLGKTAQSLATLEFQRQLLGIPGPFLVVAPLTTLGHWKRELETWTPMARPLSWVAPTRPGPLPCCCTFGFEC